MVPLRILTLIVSSPAQPSILVLEPIEESLVGMKRILPIWIGPHEAGQLSIAIERARFPRPMTHDLFLDAITNLDARVERVVITEVQGQVFFSKLVLKQGERIIELDARPTDAIALALRQEAPLYIEESTLEQASFPYVFKTQKNEQAELDEFRLFLEEISPADFNIDE